MSTSDTPETSPAPGGAPPSSPPSSPPAPEGDPPVPEALRPALAALAHGNFRDARREARALLGSADLAPPAEALLSRLRPDPAVLVVTVATTALLVLLSVIYI